MWPLFRVTLQEGEYCIKFFKYNHLYFTRVGRNHINQWCGRSDSGWHIIPRMLCMEITTIVLTFCCSSASLFCCTITTKYSSHCFWNCTTLTLASSNSIVMFFTFSRVSSILLKPLRSLLAWSPNSFFLSVKSL